MSAAAFSRVAAVAPGIVLSSWRSVQTHAVLPPPGWLGPPFAASVHGATTRPFWPPATHEQGLVPGPLVPTRPPGRLVSFSGSCCFHCCDALSDLVVVVVVVVVLLLLLPIDVVSLAFLPFGHWIGQVLEGQSCWQVPPFSSVAVVLLVVAVVALGLVPDA